MKILFSPSEAKYSGGDKCHIDKNNYIFPKLYDKRLEMIIKYNNFISKASDPEKIKLFGTKKQSVLEYYSGDIFSKKCMKAVERYDGVAYDYLQYQTLTTLEKGYIDHNVIIFSNLFGPLLAGDIGLPDYKLKQGEKISGEAPEKFYHRYFTQSLDAFLSDEHYLDLRAGFYNKFYKPSSEHTTLKFIKNGKVVSHWAKAYRGIVLRNLAINNISNIDQFIQMEIENLSIKEILKRGIHTEVIYDINI